MNILNKLFPPYCISCQKLTQNNSNFYSYICAICLKKIEIIEDYHCASCQKLTPFGKTCKSCFKKFPINGLIVATDYRNPILKDLIHFLKYRYVKDLALPLSWLLFKKLENFNWKNVDDWVIIPVPLAKRRLRSRGFNQSRLIAQNLSKWLNIPIYSDIIERTKFTVPQMEIKNYAQRIENIKNSFKIVKGSEKEGLKNKKILLVDDVSTTGATLLECSKALRPFVNEVWGCVVAK